MKVYVVKHQVLDYAPVIIDIKSTKEKGQLSAQEKCVEMWKAAIKREVPFRFYNNLLAASRIDIEIDSKKITDVLTVEELELD